MTPSKDPTTSGPPRSSAMPATAPPYFGSRLVALTMIAGLLAGLTTWAIGEATFHVFDPPLTKSQVMSASSMEVAPDDQAKADVKKGMLAYTILGGVIGLALGLAGGLARHSLTAGVQAGGLGLALGGGLSVATGAVVLPIYDRIVAATPDAASDDMMKPLLVHGLIWAAGGLAGGLALGVGIGGGPKRIAKAALGGFLGAALGGVIFDFAGVILFPESKTTDLISASWGTRMLARILVAGLAGLVAGILLNMKRGNTAPAPVA